MISTQLIMLNYQLSLRLACELGLYRYVREWDKQWAIDEVSEF